jgi:hypothetical protein
MDTASVMYVAKLMLEVVRDVAGTAGQGQGEITAFNSPTSQSGS